MNVFELFAKIGLDTTEYDHGLDLIKNGASAVGSLGAKALGAATAAVAAFGVASVKTGMGFDSAMSQVAATMGKTVDQMMGDTATVNLSWGEFTGNLREYAQEMGANTVFSATQAAEALNYMALAGYDTQKSMETLPSVLNLAAAGSMNLASASDMVTDAETALGLAGKETEDGIPRTTALIDEMARTASKTNTSVSQLGSAILTIGGTAKLMNGGMVELADGTERAYDGTTELSTALGLLADNGIKGSAAGTSLRNILSSLSSDKFKKSFGELGISAYDSEGKMRSLKDILADMNDVMSDMTDEEKTGLINSTFNQRDLKSVNALLATTGARWDEITLALLDSKGAAEEMAKTQLDNLNGDITLFRSALEGAQIALSDKVTPALRDFVKEGTEGISGFTKKLTEGDIDGAMESIGKSIGTAFTKALTLGPQLLSAGGSLINGIVAGMAAAAAQVDFVHVVIPMLVGLSGKIREKSGELVTAGIDIVKGIVQGIESGGSTFSIPIQTIFSNMLGAITDNIPVLFDAGLEMLKGLGEGIGENLPMFLEETVLPMILQFSEFVRESAGRLTETGIDFILNLAQGIMDSLPTLIEQVPQIIINFAGAINDNAPKLLVGGVKLIITIIQGIISAIPTLVANIPKIFQAVLAVWTALNWVNLGKNVIEFIKNGIDQLAQNVPQTLKDIGNKAIEWFKSVNWANAGQQAINFIRTAILAIATHIPQTVMDIASRAIAWFKSVDWASAGSKAIEFIKTAIANIASHIPQAIKDIASNAIEWFKGVDWAGAGSAVIGFIKDSITGLATDIPYALWDIAEQAWDWFNDVDWFSLGSNIIDGIVDGLQSGVRWITDAATSVAQKAKDAAENLLGIASPSKVFRDEVGKMIDKGLALGIEQNAEDVVRSAEDLSRRILTPFDDLGTPTMGAMIEGSSTGEYQTGISDSIADAVYTAVMMAMQDGGFTMQLDGREVGRVLRESGVAMA